MLLHALIVISLQCAACFGCKLYSRYWFETSSGRRTPARCLNLPTVEQIAICLLQVNGISKLMRCSIDGPDQALLWDVTPGSTTDEFNLVPGADAYNDGINRWTRPSDGWFPATPRGILVEAAHACVHDETSLGYLCDSDLIDVFKRCPYEDFTEFLDCLCCEDIVNDDFDDLQFYIEGIQVGATEYLLEKSDFQWTCENTMCNRMGEIEMPRALREWIAQRPEKKRRGLEGAETTRTFPPDGSQMETPSRTPTSRTPLPTDGTRTPFSTYDVSSEEETETQTGNGESTPTPLGDERGDGTGGGEEDAAFRFAPCWKALVFWLLAWVMYNTI